MPALLQRARGGNRRIERNNDGTYRFIYASKQTTTRLIVTVDPSLTFPFTSIGIQDEDRPSVVVHIRVNQGFVVDTIPMPSPETVRRLFRLTRRSNLDSNLDVGVVAMALLPLALAAGDGGKEDLRQFVDDVLGKKSDWKALKARYERDLPRLRKIIPLPATTP